MRIGRTLPPAAAPIYLRDLLWGILGLGHGEQELARFEWEIKEFFCVDYCFLVSSGKAALTLILKALRELYPNRDRVLIPAYTCYSVPSAIVRAGLKVALCEMDRNTLDFDYNHLFKLLHPGPSQSNGPKKRQRPFLAVVPAHLYGIPSDIDRLRSLLDGTGVVIVEDAAQAMGGHWRNRKLGTIGDVGFFSLGRGKALSTVEGGIILTNREHIAQKISALLTHVPDYSILELTKLIMEAISLSLFMCPSLFWFPKSLPFLRLGETIYDPNFNIKRMSPFQAGMARRWKSKIKVFRKVRSENASMWSTWIKHMRAPELSMIGCPPECDLIRYPLKVTDGSLRRSILYQGEQQGLGLMPGYPNPVSEIPALTDGLSNQRFPAAKEYSQQLVTLPIHPYVRKRERKKIAALLTQLTRVPSNRETQQDRMSQ